ncbi:hypothetical protein NBRC116586_14950 [Pseudooceanicola nitratireducens]
MDAARRARGPQGRKGLRRAPQGGLGAREPKGLSTPGTQICFSGICTTSPSRASVTLIWQVRRERAGSGS